MFELVVHAQKNPNQKPMCENSQDWERRNHTRTNCRTLTMTTSICYTEVDEIILVFVNTY